MEDELEELEELEEPEPEMVVEEARFLPAKIFGLRYPAIL
jgi:hypothetical protein